MKIIAVIPARYNSSRLPGKPLANICGKPMIWWVYNQVIKVKEFFSVIVATDDSRIEEYCINNKMNVVMTSSNHENHIYRIHEVMQLIEADYYVCINGDEPLIEPNTIRAILAPIQKNENFFAINLMTTIKDPTQVVDFSKIKVVVDENNYGMYMSRSPVPYPRGESLFHYKKYVGVECMTKESLQFYVSSPQTKHEKIEDIDHLRFLESGKKIKFVDVESDTLSVDTKKDLEKVIHLVKERQSL